MTGWFWFFDNFYTIVYFCPIWSSIDSTLAELNFFLISSVTIFNPLKVTSQKCSGSRIFDLKFKLIDHAKSVCNHGEQKFFDFICIFNG